MRNKILYLMAVFTGLVLSVGFFVSSSRSQVLYNNQDMSCLLKLSIDQSRPATRYDSGGVPFVMSKYQAIFFDPCADLLTDRSSNNSKDKMRLSKEYATSWQFYANWAIWSLPFLGIAYLYTKKRENTRH